jgi:hypothetical protein
MPVCPACEMPGNIWLQKPPGALAPLVNDDWPDFSGKSSYHHIIRLIFARSQYIV